MKEKEWDFKGPRRRFSKKKYNGPKKHNNETTELTAFKKTKMFLDYSPLFAALVVSLPVSKFKIESLTRWKTYLKNRYENGEVNEEKDFCSLFKERMHPYQMKEQRSMLQQLQKNVFGSMQRFHLRKLFQTYQRTIVDIPP